jgi:hypothetical protein
MTTPAKQVYYIVPQTNVVPQTLQNTQTLPVLPVLSQNDVNVPLCASGVSGGVSRSNDIQSDDIKRAVIEVKAAECKLVRQLKMSNWSMIEENGKTIGEIYIVNMFYISKMVVDYETSFWDNLIDPETAACVPLTVPFKEGYNLWAVYTGGATPSEYRITLDKKWDDYHGGNTKTSPYTTFRYVNCGGLEGYPKFLIMDPHTILNGTEVKFEILKEWVDGNKCIVLDATDCNNKANNIESAYMEIFEIYSPGQPYRSAIEYRIVLDKDRQEFYHKYAITPERNREIMDEEDAETADESGVKIIRE